MVINKMTVAGIGTKGPFLEAITDNGEKVRIVVQETTLTQAAQELRKWRPKSADYSPRRRKLEPLLERF